MEIQLKHDIISEIDVKQLVDTFYDKVNADEMLSPIFNGFAEINWQHHLPKMYAFWNFILLGIPGYKGQPFPMHARLPIEQEHFKRWVELFIKNVDDHFIGNVASMAKTKAEGIALTFQYKLGLIK